MAIDKNLFPFGGNNAIQNVVFVVEWAKPLDDPELNAVRGVHTDPKNTDFRKALPNLGDQKAMMISIDDRVGSSVAKNVTDGVNFVRPSASHVGGVAKALNISRQNCLAVISEYSRWSSVWTEVNNWFSLVLPHILPGRPVTTFGLQYTDLFQWKADPTLLEVKEVLSEKSKFLSPNIFEVRNLWHSHHGYLDRRESPTPHVLLENINVSMLENGGQRSIQVITSHRATLTAPLWGNSVSEGLMQFMPDLHERNKVIMKDLLMPDVQAMIKLSS